MAETATTPESNNSIYLMNTCFVCNVIFVARSKASVQAGVERFRDLSEILHASSTNGEIVPETNFLCRKCDREVDEYLKIKKQIEGLIKLLEEVRKVLAKKVVDTYASTNKRRKNYDKKTSIFQAWRGKFNSSTSSQAPDPATLQQSYASILESLNVDCGMVQLESIIKPLSDNQNLAQSQDSAAAGEDNDKDDRFSTECPSPGSPGFIDSVDRDFSDIEQDRDVYVRNLPGPEELCEQERLNLASVPPVNTTIPVSETGFNSTSGLNVNAEQKLAPSTVDPSVLGITIEGQQLIAGTIQNPVADADKWSNDKRRNRPIIKTNRRTHPCKYCGKLFPSNFSLQMHERTHTGEKPFPCPVCGRSFANKAAMQKHQLTHDRSRYEGEPQYECDICGRKYHLKLSLYTHKRDHRTPVKRWIPKKPRDPNAPPRRKYKKKKKERDPNAPPKREKKPKIKKPKVKKEVQLDEQGNPIRKRRRVKRSPKPESDKPKRRRRRPGEPPEPAICSYCGKDCGTTWGLKLHELVHTGEKKFKCPICDRAFALKGNLSKHMKSHDRGKYDGEPAHICDYCGKGFYQPGTLYHHRRREHLGLREKYRQIRRQYKRRVAHQACQCKICGKQFESLYQLNYHKVRHGEKKHKCEVCDKPFWDPVNAKRHIKTHNPDFRYKVYFRYPCPACPEKLPFQSKETLRSHWNEDHKGQPIPEKFKKPPKKKVPLPPGPGEHICLVCPEVEGKRPQYRYLRSLQKHNKTYHSENPARRKWKPQKGPPRRSGGKRKRRDDDENSMSDYDSEFDSEVEFDSDKETEGAKQEIVEPSRKSLRRTRRSVTDLTKLLKDSESEEDGEETFFPESPTKSNKVRMSAPRMANTRKALVQSSRRRSMSRGRTSSPNKKSKLTDSYVKELLGGREVRLILTRSDAVVISQDCVVETKSQEIVKTKRNNKPGPKSKSLTKTSTRTRASDFIPPSASKLENSGQSNVPKEISGATQLDNGNSDGEEEEMVDETQMIPLQNDMILEEDPLSISTPASTPAILENPAISISNIEVAPEVKEEEETEDDDEGDTHIPPEPWNPRTIMTSLQSSVPLVIPNPLSKNKAAAPIIIPPSINSSSSSKDESVAKNREM